jgi:hypothetical protein
MRVCSACILQDMYLSQRAADPHNSTSCICPRFMVFILFSFNLFRLGNLRLQTRYLAFFIGMERLAEFSHCTCHSYSNKTLRANSYWAELFVPHQWNKLKFNSSNILPWFTIMIKTFVVFHWPATIRYWGSRHTTIIQYMAVGYTAEHIPAVLAATEPVLRSKQLGACLASNDVTSTYFANFRVITVPTELPLFLSIATWVYVNPLELKLI